LITRMEIEETAEKSIVKRCVQIVMPLRLDKKLLKAEYEGQSMANLTTSIQHLLFFCNA